MPDHYLVKPFSQEKIDTAMKRCIEANAEEKKKVLQIRTGVSLVPVMVENIVYVEVFNKLSVIHTIKEEISTYIYLETLFEQISDDRFLKAQRSYIVNMEYYRCVGGRGKQQIYKFEHYAHRADACNCRR